MVGIITEPVLPALDNPEPTEAKLGRTYGRRIDWAKVEAEGRAERGKAVEQAAPAVDVARIQRELDATSPYAPRLKMGTFKAPIGMRGSQFEKLRNERVQVFADHLYRQGWDLMRSRRIEVWPGPNPARDLATGLPLLGEREFIVRAWFTHRRPEPLRIELPGELLAPIQLARLPGSPAH